MSVELKSLREVGSNIPAYDEEEIPLEELLELVDMDKFNRGRQFFKRNLFQCSLGMFFSLVTGLSVRNLLDVLVATGKSSTADTARARYLHTFKHVLQWHYGNVWNRTSEAAKSIHQVRQMHVSARKLMKDRYGLMEKDGDSSLHVSQYDMSLVQCGFIGAILMYPEDLGIKCTMAELDDYVYYWRWIGQLLGMDEQHNLCTEGYDTAYRLCKAIERDVLFPSFVNPPEQFYIMAHAVTDGINKLTYLKLFSPHSIMDSIPSCSFNIKLCFIDKLRAFGLKLLLKSLYYFQGYARMLSRSMEVVYKCDQMT